MPDISYVPASKGGWILLVRGGVVLAIDLSPDSSRVSELWLVLLAGASSGEVLDEVIRTGISKAPSFVLIGDGDTGANTVLVRGSVVLRAVGATGEREISGEGVSSWSEQVVDLSVGYEVWPASVADAAATLPLVDGVVRASAFRVGRPRASAPTDPTASAPAAAPAPAHASELASAALMPVEDPVVLQVPPTPTVDPEQTLASQTVTSSATVAPPQPAAEVVAEATGYDHLFGETVHRSVEEAAVRSEPTDPAIVGPPPIAAPEGDHDGHTVMVADLAGLRAKRRAARAKDLEPPAPSYFLELSTGGREALDEPLIIGRAPTASRVSGSRVPRLVSMNTPNQDISRTHAQISAEGGTVIVTDLHSSNGTLITLPGRAAQKLRPGEPATIIVGTVIDLGDGATLTLCESS